MARAALRPETPTARRRLLRARREVSRGASARPLALCAARRRTERQAHQVSANNVRVSRPAASSTAGSNLTELRGPLFGARERTRTASI